jgi:ferredoxin
VNPEEEATMRVIVNYDLCEGNARCMRVAPAIFKVDDEDQLHVLIEKPSEDQREALETAVAICPRQAISLAESE